MLTSSTTWRYTPSGGLDEDHISRKGVVKERLLQTIPAVTQADLSRLVHGYTHTHSLSLAQRSRLEARGRVARAGE